MSGMVLVMSPARGPEYSSVMENTEPSPSASTSYVRSPLKSPNGMPSAHTMRRGGSMATTSSLNTRFGVQPTEVVCLDELRATRITRHSFTPPADFDLAGFWRAHVASQSA